MRNRIRFAFAGLAAAMLLSFAVGSASANRLSTTNQNIRAVWSSLELAIEGSTVRCPVTLEGSFHSRTISKVRDALIGYVTRAIVGGSSGGTSPPCTNGTATILRETLPWHLRYESFEGTLPTIRRVFINMIGASFKVDPAGILPACLARTTAANPARGWIEIEAGGTVTNITADENKLIPLSNGIGCEFIEGRFIGSGRVTLLGTTATIRVTLI